jgi:hypothetical protein
MAEKVKVKGESGKSGDREIHFKCCLCEKEKPLQEMRTVTRFVPVLVVCQDCAKTLR